MIASTIASLVSLALVGCEQPTDTQLPIRVTADAAAPTLTFSVSRPDFTAQFPHLPLEDFEAGRVPDANVVDCPGPLDATSDNRCFSPGEIKPGISFNSDQKYGPGEAGLSSRSLGLRGEG